MNNNKNEIKQYILNPTSLKLKMCFNKDIKNDNISINNNNKQLIERSDLNSNKPLLTFEFELNPINKNDGNLRIKLRTQPIKVYFYVPIIFKLKQFFYQKR